MLCGVYGLWVNATVGPVELGDPNAGLNQIGNSVLRLPHAVEKLQQATAIIPAADCMVVVSGDTRWTRDEVYRLAVVALYPRPVVLWDPAKKQLPPGKIGALLFYRTAPFSGMATEPLGDEAALAVLDKMP